MLLNEFIYFDEDQAEMFDKGRYDPQHDSSVIKSTDLRKSRLTLRMLNSLRKAGDSREQETKEELELVRKMYATPPPDASQL
jgi:hypothetical protein